MTVANITIQVNGEKVSTAIAAVIAAFSPQAQANNFRTILQFITKEVKNHTPGSGTLREAWKMRSSIDRTSDGWNFEGVIYNAKESEKLFYLAAISGEVKPKLKADDTQQTYRDVIPILNKGSKPHVIKPRRYKNLVFRTSASPGPGSPDTSNLVITKSVSHPGTKAYGTISVPFAKLLTLCRAAVLGTQEQVIKAW